VIRYSNALLRLEKRLSEQLGQEGNHTFISEEQAVFAEEHAPCLERLPLALELLDANNTRDKLDILLSEQILVLPLRVLRDQTDA
jgi:hypothetical protein